MYLLNGIRSKCALILERQSNGDLHVSLQPVPLASTKLKIDTGKCQVVSEGGAVVAEWESAIAFEEQRRQFETDFHRHVSLTSPNGAGHVRFQVPPLG